MEEVEQPAPGDQQQPGTKQHPEGPQQQPGGPQLTGNLLTPAEPHDRPQDGPPGGPPQARHLATKIQRDPAPKELMPVNQRSRV